MKIDFELEEVLFIMAMIRDTIDSGFYEMRKEAGELTQEDVDYFHGYARLIDHQCFKALVEQVMGENQREDQDE